MKTRDFNSLQNFGGVIGIAEALGADLENGISSNEEDLCYQCRSREFTTTQDPVRGFIPFLKKSSNNYVILLLFISAVLSIGFGIKQEGLDTGWYDGVIIIIAIILLVLLPSIWDSRLQNSKRASKNPKEDKIVDVFRNGAIHKVPVSHILIGDIACLKRGHLVPADGLFVSGEFIKLDSGSESIINEKNPFLFYGAKVTNGNGRMLVTSVGMRTEWVLFLRYQFGKEDGGSGLPDLKGKQTSSKEIIDAIKRIVIKPYGRISTLTTSLTVLLVGIMEGIPFVIALGITYWNKKVLHDKVSAQELLACVTMGLATTICTDKTGELTLNPQEVDMFWIGEEFITEDSFVATDVLEALCDGIGLLALLPPPTSGCSTEDPLLSWAASELGLNIELLKQSCSIVEMKRLNSNEEGSGVLINKNSRYENELWLHWNGPAEKILSMCSFYCDSKGTTKNMDEQKTLSFQHIIEHMQSKHLETIAFAYKQMGVETLDGNNLVLIGLLVLETIAAKCGMHSNLDNLVLDGESFRNCSDDERMAMIDKIFVMGNSLPSDRLLLMQCLKDKGHIVATVGVKTSETPQLKEADVGIAMGTRSSGMIKEISDIIIWEFSFSLLVDIIRIGRCIYSNIQKYIQLQVTMNISGLLITFVTKVSFGYSPITGIQLIWSNVIVTFFGGLALLTEPPTEKLMEHPSVRRNEPLITKTMWRNIISQALYQAATLVTFQFKGKAILGISNEVSKTIIFNSFIICQVFNQVSARELKQKNVFTRNFLHLWFWVAVAAIMVLQVAFQEFANKLAGNVRLNWMQWGVCFIIGVVSWAIDWVTKCASDFHNEWFTSQCSSHIGSTSMTASTPPELSSISEIPLINGNSTSLPI
ncbi:Calcium-transporting ATPase [Quillaja saponaria]|uniref:Calcium-transporting ATPase n=1 Tax=Quillaja saponaria TaxID=32244 RepID=A0AAD7PUF0_QUISA|nr:Calcium-transporting ATPase [Quillaja saponaria]